MNLGRVHGSSPYPLPSGGDGGRHLPEIMLAGVVDAPRTLRLMVRKFEAESVLNPLSGGRGSRFCLKC